MCIIESVSTKCLLCWPSGDTRWAGGVRQTQMQNTILNVIQIFVSVLLVVVILVQVRGQGTGLFGSAESSFRTRRGLEKSLFQFTIGLIFVFIVVSILSASSRFL